MRRFFEVNPMVVWLVLAVSACSPEKPRAAKPPVPVEVAIARKETVPLELQAIGTVEPFATVQLKSKVLGEIVKVNFADGAMVKAGDLLFSIDPQPYEVALKRAQANRDVAQVAVDNAAEQLGRYTTLKEQGAASKEQFSQFESNSRSQLAELESRKADVAGAELSLEWTGVKAPISGRVGAATLKVGNIVQAGGDVLAVINQTSPIKVIFSVPEGELSLIRKWSAVGALSVMAMDPDSHKELDRGTLDFINNTVDRDTGMIVLKGVFPNQNEVLWPGQFVDVTLYLTDEKDQVVIPTIAIMESQEGSQVLVVKEGLPTVRKVEVARGQGDISIIRSGLEAGEKVITSGQLRVEAGVKVKEAQEEK